MKSDDAKFIKRKIRAGPIDVHSTEKALILRYEIEAIILGSDEQPIIADTKECQKLIRLKNFTKLTDCTLVANEVVNNCKLIHPTKISEVIHLLTYLQNRNENAEINGRDVSPSQRSESSSTLSYNSSTLSASLLNLEEYVELLYEEMSDKTKGSALILQLAKDTANLDELSKNESMLSALSRVLREDWKKSIDLSANIIKIFARFSDYDTFYPVLLQYKVGSLCMDIMQYQFAKYDEKKSELSNLPDTKAIPAKTKPGRSLLPVSRSIRSASDQRGAKSQIPVPGSVKIKLNSQTLTKQNSTESLLKPSADLSTQTRHKFESFVRKQNELMRACVNLLFNLSQNERVEDKMRRRGIVEFLYKLLERTSSELLLSVVTFLGKLSSHKENVDTMFRLDIVEKLNQILVETKNVKLIDETLRLLFNLSFDSRHRDKMIKIGALPQFLKFLEGDRGHNYGRRQMSVLRLLYHFSMDDKVKSMFSYTDSVPMIFDMLVTENDSNKDFFELVSSICVNLSLNNRNAELITSQNGLLSLLLSRAFQTKNIVLVKILRNISSHGSAKDYFLEYVDIICKTISENVSNDLTVECVGLLANLNVPDVDFYNLFKKFNLVPWIKSCISSGDECPDDLVLELVILLSTSCTYDENCAELLIQTNVFSSLIDLLAAKQVDDELVIQVVYTFYQALQHPISRDYIVRETNAPAYFIELMHDNNPSLRKLCRSCLHIIKDFDESWTERVMIERFTKHNEDWLEMIQNQSGIDTEQEFKEEDDDEIFPRYNLLQQSLMLQSGASSRMSLCSDSYGSSLDMEKV